MSGIELVDTQSWLQCTSELDKIEFSINSVLAPPKIAVNSKSSQFQYRLKRLFSFGGCFIENATQAKTALSSNKGPSWV